MILRSRNPPTPTGTVRLLKRMTPEKIDKEMSKVKDHGVGLVTVAKAVSSLNLTLAHHTAWSEERFETMDQRFETIDRRFEAIDQRFEAIDRRFEAIDQRFDRMDR